MIYLRTLGPLDVTVDGSPAPADLLWRKNVALLLYLARAPARRCTRDHAIGLLWPDKDQAAARQSLREAVRVLRRCVGDAHLLTEGDQLQLVDGAAHLDTERFDGCVARHDWASAAPLIAGEFVEGFAVPDASAFEDWLQSERWHWRGRAMDALINHAEALLAAGDLLGADEPARRALKLDPLSDRALRTLMRRLALAGDGSAALDVYTRFAQRATREGAAPEPETEALAKRLRSGRKWKLPDQALAADRSVEWRRVPLIGRERELANVLEQWRDVRSGRLALVVVEAEGGGGKTRLAEEVLARIALDGGACAVMRAVPADQSHAFNGIVSLARGGLIEAPGVAAAAPAALAALGQAASEWAERFSGAARPGRGEPSELGAAVIEVLRSASAEQPVLLVFDDAQWIDRESLDVIETLLRDLARAPILVFIATADAGTAKVAELRARIGRDVRGVAVTLGAFDSPAIQALVRWAFPSYAPEQIDRLSRRIAADSAGVPLLAAEICHAVAQGLDLDRTSGAWPRPFSTLQDTRPGDLPDTVVAAIRVGFNCLSKDAQAALTAAAVLGERVSASQVGKAAHLEGRALDAALDELEWRRWLVGDREAMYSFVARIVREVVDRDMVTAGQRQRILQA